MLPPPLVAPPCAVAGLVTLATLPPKGGKSTTACGLVADASQRGVRCFMLTLDEPIGVTLQRVHAFGADPDMVWLDDTFEPDTLKTQLAAASAQVLAVDHIGKLAELSPEFGANSQGDAVLWGRLLNPFTTLARETNLATVLLGQSRRSDGKYAGSHAIAATVDLLCEMEAKDGGLICHPRGRVRLPTFRVHLDDTGRPVFSADDDGDIRPPVSEAGVRDVTLRAVFRLLLEAEPEGLRPSKWERRALGELQLSGTHFDRARSALLGAGRVTKLGRLYRTAPSGERWFTPFTPFTPFGPNGVSPIHPIHPTPLTSGGDGGMGRVLLAELEQGDAFEAADLSRTPSTPERRTNTGATPAGAAESNTGNTDSPLGGQCVPVAQSSSATPDDTFEAEEAP
jgi:hypothetical protein